MKRNLLLLVCVFLLSVSNVMAWDFSHVNNDGVELYYTILDADFEAVEVSYKDASAAYLNAKTINVPTFVTKNGENYGVIAIGDSAFFGAQGIETVNLNVPIETIGFFAFMNSSVKTVSLPFSVVTIEAHAFQGCENLKGITLPYGLTHLGNCAFWGSGITSIDLPSQLQNLNGGAFTACKSLTRVNMGSGVRNIDTLAFSNCTGLTSVDVGNNVSSIGIFAFYICRNLSSVTFGLRLNFIEDKAFSGCENLKRIYCNALVPPTISDSTFAAPDNQITVVVPNSLYDLYKMTEHWKDMNIVKANTSVENVECDVEWRMEGNVMVLEEEMDVVVWSMKGDVVYSGWSDRVELPVGGVYIVRGGGSVWKCVRR